MGNLVIWILLVCFLFLLSNIGQLEKDISRMNRKLDKIAEKIGVSYEIDDKFKDELKVLIAQGKKVQAVKKYREVTGEGLLEAKNYIDSLEGRDNTH